MREEQLKFVTWIKFLVENETHLQILDVLQYFETRLHQFLNINYH